MLTNAIHTMVGSGSSSTQEIQYLVNNVLSQTKELLPIVIPVIIGFIAFRKGYKFIKSALRSA